MNKENERVYWIDITKGIAIILVVIGHTICYGNTGPIIKSVIFSFHMPLFFIMSGYTASLPSSTEDLGKKTRKIALSLIIPAYTAYIIKTTIFILINKSKLDLTLFINQLYSLLFIDSGNTNFQNFVTSSFGYVWFLPILFFCRTLFNYLNIIIEKRKHFSIVCILSLLGYVWGSQQRHFIFGLDIVLTVLPLLFLGNSLKKSFIFTKPLRYTFISFLLWFCGFIVLYPNPKSNMYLDVWNRIYPLYPLCFLVSIAGTIFLCCISICLSKFQLSKFFALIGKHSLIFFLIHYFDTLWEPLWKSFSDQYIRLVSRLLINIVLFLVIILILKIVKILRSKKTSGDKKYE